jgi:hypothetical protein
MGYLFLLLPSGMIIYSFFLEYDDMHPRSSVSFLGVMIHRRYSVPGLLCFAMLSFRVW